jgi:hypothetical protein
VGHITTNNTASIGTVLIVADTTKTNHLVVNGTTALTGALNVGGATNFGGTTTINASTTLAVTTADYLTVGNAIVSTAIPIRIDEANLTTKQIMPFNAAYKIVAIQESHGVIATGANVFNIEKLTGTTAPGSGTNCMLTTSSLVSTINTVLTPSLAASAADYTFASGDRMSIKVGPQAGGCAALQGAITVYVVRV